MSKVLITVPVWNRKKITELSLKQLNKYKGEGNELWVYNDWSSEYDNDWLEDKCDKVFKLPSSKKVVAKNETNSNGMGVQHLRWHQFREFSKQSKFDYLYMTDNDTIHDPDFMDVMIKLHSKYITKSGIKLPVCLYNSVYHSQAQNNKFQNDEVMLRITAPGVSMYYSKEMVDAIVEELDKQTEDPIYAWDYRAQEWLKRPWITPKTSYVEHFGASPESMHTPEGMWNRDRAVNPTEYLQDIREDVISYLDGDIDNINIK